MDVKVYINDIYDITNYCVSIPDIKESVEESFKIDNIYSITVKDYEQYFDVTNKYSIFYGVPLSHLYITVKDAKNTLGVMLKGVITEVMPLGSILTEISFKSDIKNIDTKVKNSLYKYNLYNIFKILKKTYKLPINLGSVLHLPESEYIYSIRVNEDEELKITELLNLMSEILGVYIYQSSGFIHLSRYYPQTNGGKRFTLPKSKIYEITKNIDYEKIINSYNVKYFLHTEQPRTDIEQIGQYSLLTYGEKPTKEIDGSQQSNFIIMEEIGAYQAGKNYIDRFKERLITLDVRISYDYFWYLKLGDVYEIDSIYYQLIEKSLDTSGAFLDCIFRELYV